MLTIEIDDAAFLASAEIGVLETSIFSDARSQPSPSGRWGDYPYFWPVDLGRGPVTAKFAKALRIPLPDGTVIYRKSVGPAAPRNIRKNAFVQLDSAAINAGVSASGTPYPGIRQWLAAFLRMMAYFYSQSLAEATPGGLTGKLRQSYRATTTV